MRETSNAVLDELDRRPDELRLVVESEPGLRVFAQNLRDLLNPPEAVPLHVQSQPGDFWPDVFVDGALPWRRLLESGGYHILAIMLILAGSRWLALQPRVIPQVSLSHADVVYYSQSEYLPPLDTRRASSRRYDRGST